VNKLLINIAALIFSSTGLFSQRAYTSEFSLGYGYYETFTLGFSYYLNPVHKIGIAAGSSFMINNEMYYSVSLSDNIALFRTKKDKFQNYKWFLTGKVLYWDMKDKFYRWNVLSLSPALTRSIPINSNLNLALDIGPVFNIVLESYRRTYEGLGWPYHIMPNMRILINYRL
jgi:hypothetical protein